LRGQSQISGTAEDIEEVIVRAELIAGYGPRH
jgi:hypothetical protein